MSENKPPLGGTVGLTGNNVVENHTLTKQDIDKMIEHLKGMEGKVVGKGKPITLNPDLAAWYVAYGT